MKLKIKYLNDSKKIEPIDIGDWIDLRCNEDVHMKAGEFRLIKLGVAMQLPTGYEAHILPRSSTFKKYHILMANSTGIVDESYCGDGDEWLFPAYATEETFIPRDTRICQFRIFEHQPQIELEEVESLGNADVVE